MCLGAFHARSMLSSLVHILTPFLHAMACGVSKDEWVVRCRHGKALQGVVMALCATLPASLRIDMHLSTREMVAFGGKIVKNHSLICPICRTHIHK
jgi:hypothetical protein